MNETHQVHWVARDVRHLLDTSDLAYFSEPTSLLDMLLQSRGIIAVSNGRYKGTGILEGGWILIESPTGPSELMLISKQVYYRPNGRVVRYGVTASGRVIYDHGLDVPADDAIEIRRR